MNQRRWAGFAALLVSTMLSLAFLEVALRIIFDPVDLLKPDLERHPVLGHAIVPGTGGHDALGFRNPAVLDHPDVIVLGDSMTYGSAARMRQSWPSQLARMSIQTVYNMGIGGYGPAEYAYLLEQEVIPRRPKRILIGLYFGNDLHNAYVSVLRRRHWQELRASTPGDWPAAGDPAPRSTYRAVFNDEMDLRSWLRGRSMLMRSIEQSPLGQLVNSIGDVRPLSEDQGCHIALDAPFTTVLKLDKRMRGIDVETREVAIGLDLTLSLLQQMAEAARDARIDLAVLLIPSKERVLAPHAAPVEPTCARLLERFVASETHATRRIQDLLDAEGVAWITPLAALSEAATHERIYLRSGDTHPNAAGYRVISDQVMKQAGEAGH